MSHWGLRATEAAHLVPEWVSTQRGHLKIPGRCTCRTCKESDESAWTPKTDASNRTLPIHQHEESWAAVKAYVGAIGHDPVTRQAVWQIVKRVADRANLTQRVYPHALRATAATMFADMGLNEHQLCRILGWGDPRMARPYVQSSGIVAEKALSGRDLEWW